MTTLSKEQQRQLGLDILSQKYRVTELAKKYKISKGRVSQISKEILEGRIKPSSDKIKQSEAQQHIIRVAQDAKAAELNKTKLDTIHRRVVYLALLEARIKAYKRKFDQAADPQPGVKPPRITPSDEKFFIGLVRATEPFLRGIDQAEAMAKALLGEGKDGPAAFDTSVYAGAVKAEAEAFLAHLLPRLGEAARAEVLKAITEMGDDQPR
jgi:hypothetical protein